MRVLGNTISLVWTSNNGLLGSKYFGMMTLSSITSTSFPMELIVGASRFLLPILISHSYLMKLLYMGTSLMREILTHILLNSILISTSFVVCALWVANFSRQGGLMTWGVGYSFYYSTFSIGEGGQASINTFQNQILISWILEPKLDRKLLHYRVVEAAYC